MDARPSLSYIIFKFAVYSFIMSMRSYVSWGLFSLVNTSMVFGWSGECHSIIAYIAGSLLDENESQYLQELMGWDIGSPDLLREQLVDIAMDADSQLEEWEQYKYYHYAHALPSFATPWDKATMCGHSKNPTVCVVTGIAIWTAKAASISNTPAERQFAVKMITHLMGDIHQPLHIGLWKDFGGLKIERVWPSYNPYRENKDYNLHELWDRGLFRHYEVEGIRAGTIPTPPPQDMFLFDSDDESDETPIPDPGWKFLANELVASLNETTIAAYKIRDPSRDTRDLSRTSRTIRLPKAIATESIHNVRDFAYKNEDGVFISSGSRVSQTYISSRVEVMKLILSKAGVRLGDLLKHIISFSRAAEEAAALAATLDAAHIDSQSSETSIGEPLVVQDP